MEILVFWVLPILFGYLFGRRVEKKHYQSIIQREKALLQLPTSSSKHLIGPTPPIRHAQLVHGSVVISIDYFKRILAGLRGLIGGPVQAYETLLDRARREAILRLKESCRDADQIINLRLETSSISQGAKNTIGSVEVLAYGTAVYFESKH
jgi:uncharacterized protein YbjQ (UPF0145 family)